MKWIEFAVYTTDAGLDTVAAALTAIGLEQLAIEESSESVAAFLEHAAPNWDFADAVALSGKNGPCVKAYIAELLENGALLLAARNAVAALREMEWQADPGPLLIRETRIDEEDWANNWKQYYKPLPIGDRLLICPSWELDTLAPDLKNGRRVLSMDPGMAFGTGAHHTTRMCLELMDKRVKNGDTVLDIGCGSGILAVAALLLGAKHAECVDIDPVAERVVKENLKANGIGASRCGVRTGNFLADERLRKAVGEGYDIVAANIVANVVIALAPLVPPLLKQGGLFIASGIIDERAEEVSAALENAGFTIAERLRASEEAPEGIEASGWVAYLSQWKG
ncbi:MAG TPA: 50S ribosomal protein L11 methyltransferase [Feifaniaceae bacterium]|nr:50S ribosomal protein L11 methyltransferase [Feifaniaceae bacterium]